jgi:hypothetical protein
MPPSTWINDKKFIKDLNRLKELRSFYMEQTANLDVSASIQLSFGELNQLEFQKSGREPTKEEWEKVERYTLRLFSLLTEQLRRKFILGEMPWSMTWIPLIFAASALASLVLSVIVPQFNVFWLGLSESAKTLPFYLTWLVSLVLSARSRLLA